MTEDLEQLDTAQAVLVILLTEALHAPRPDAYQRHSPTDKGSTMQETHQLPGRIDLTPAGIAAAEQIAADAARYARIATATLRVSESLQELASAMGRPNAELSVTIGPDQAPR